MKFSVCFAKLPSQLTGGLIADIKNYNYHVSVRQMQFHICSGSIISTSHILTSSSCIVLENEGEYKVLLANIQILSGTNDKFGRTSGRIHEISYVIIHENYNARHLWIDDIGIKNY